MANTFQKALKAGVSTSLVDIYSAGNKTVVIGLTLSNTSGGSINASVQFKPVSGDAPYLVKNIPIPTGSSVEIMGGNKIVMDDTDKLKAISSAATSLDTIVSYMEITA